MTMFHENLGLLPSGFADLLPPDADREAAAIASLLNLFSRYGYARVKPPLVEFEESLLAPGPGAQLAQDTFRLMDPGSHRMMGIRSDITPQIARLAASRLHEEPRPLRLAYANDVLRTRAGQQRVERQFCQVGCELISETSIEADTELCMMALLGLHALGVKNITIDLAAPRLVDTVLEGASLNVQQKKDVRMAVSKRDSAALAAIDESLARVLNAVLEAAGPWETAQKAYDDLDLPAAVRAQIEVICGLAQDIQAALDEMDMGDITISLDPLEHQGFDYQRGVAFTLFSSDARGELGRGGRYDIVFGEDAPKESAAGFTLYMDSVLQVLPAPEKERTLYVPLGTSWAELRTLQEESWTILRGHGKDDAVRAICSHILENNQIVENKG